MPRGTPSDDKATNYQGEMASYKCVPQYPGTDLAKDNKRLRRATIPASSAENPHVGGSVPSLGTTADYPPTDEEGAHLQPLWRCQQIIPLFPLIWSETSAYRQPKVTGGAAWNIRMQSHKEVAQCEETTFS